MAKSKHSKVKNTGILFELLARQLTADTLRGVENSPAVEIIREYFIRNTSLKKELQLYQSLIKQKYSTQLKADRFIDAVINERKKLTQKSLAKQKYSLIKEIKKHYPIEKFFATSVAKYKEYASIYRVFESLTTTDIQNPTTVLQSRFTIVEHITGKTVSTVKKSKLMEQFTDQDKDTRLLSYRILIDKFNSKYKNLDANQKNLLEQYINNVSNKKTLAEYINNKSATLYSDLTKLNKKIDDKIVSIKLSEVIKHIKPLTSMQSIRDKHVLNMMRYYDLYKELKNVAKGQTRQIV